MEKKKDENPSEPLVDAITELLIGDSPTRRAEAARKLGSSNNRFVSTYLIQGLADRSSEVRFAAVEVLGQIGDKKAIQPLRDLLDRETDPLDRDSIVRALEQIENGNRVTPNVPEDDEPEGPSVPRRNPDEFTEARLADSLPGDPIPPAANSPEPAPRDQAHQLTESYHRAVDEKELLENARQFSSQEGSRRAAEELARLEAESESLSQLQDDLARRRVELESARKTAAQEESRLKELESRVKTAEAARRQVESEYLQLEAEYHQRRTEAQLRIEELQRQADEEETRSVEHQRSLKQISRLRAEAADHHRAEAEKLRAAQTELQEAAQELARVRAGVEAARQDVEKETLKLSEARERLRLEESVYHQTEEERLALQIEIKARAEAERHRLEEMRAAAIESRRAEEEAAVNRANEENRRLAELEAMRKTYQQEADGRAAKAQQLRIELESLRDACHEQLKSIEAAEVRRRNEEEAFHQAKMEAQLRIEESNRRHAEEDACLKAEHAAWVRMEDDARRRSTEQQQLIKEARRRGETEKGRLAQVTEEARRSIAAEQAQIDEARAEAEAAAQQLIELESLKHKAEEEAKNNKAQEKVLRAKLAAMRQSAEDQRREISAMQSTLAAQEEQFRLLELEKLSATETERLHSDEQKKRLQKLEVQIAGLHDDRTKRSQTEALLRKQIEDLQREENAQIALISAADKERQAVEERINQADSWLTKVQDELRERVEQEEEQRIAHEAANAQVEEDARKRVRAEAERQAEQKRKQLEAEEKLLRQKTEELSRRHTEVAAARRAVEDDLRRLTEAQERIAIHETALLKAEQDRLRLEAEVKLKAQIEEERLEQTREKVVAAHKDIGELRFRADEEERNLAELRTILANVEQSTKKLNGSKSQLRTEIATLNGTEDVTAERANAVKADLTKGNVGSNGKHPH